VKAGTGSLTLSGTSTYPGTTTVSGGRLLVNSPGALAGGGAVAVKSGAILGGSGSIVGTITVESGGTLQPGLGFTNTPATFTCSNLTFSAGSTNLLVINSTNSPNANKIVYTGALTNGGTLVVSNAGPALAAGNSFTLFSGSNPVGVYSATNLPALGSTNLSWVFTNGILSVVSSLNTTRTNIVVALTNGVMTLSWPASHLGWELQGQTNKLNVGISNNWIVVAGSTATNRISIPIVSTNPTVFYRLHLP
ncbi:MAG: autotransporter-associated beta strand repeat-containing protein, partial [Verrucomicrobia bacterium]|nr:autotransporter-associated beta strand repeat-containing protein [Verrucomicrobiota bacterium]